MRKFYKVSLITAACLIGAGIVLTAIGGTAAIHKSYRILKDEAGNWNFSERFQKGDAMNMEQAEAFEAEKVDNLTVYVGACRLIVEEKKMEEEQILVAISGNERLKCEMSGDELVVKGHQSDFWSYIGNGGAPEIRITVPEGKRFSELTLKTGAGQAEISGLSAEQIEIQAGAGEVIMNRVAAGEMTLEAGAGSMEAEQMDVEKIEISVGAGSFFFEGKAPEELDADCAAGELTMQLTGKESDHNYSIRCAAGDVEIGDSSGSVLASEKYIDNGTDSEYSIDCSMGSISITFAEE